MDGTMNPTDQNPNAPSQAILAFQGHNFLHKMFQTSEKYANYIKKYANIFAFGFQTLGHLDFRHCLKSERSENGTKLKCLKSESFQISDIHCAQFKTTIFCLQEPDESGYESQLDMSEMYLEDGTKVIIVISPDSPSDSEDSSHIGIPSVKVDRFVQICISLACILCIISDFTS